MSAGPHHGVLDSICSKNLFSPASLLTKVRHVLHAFGQSGEQVTSSGRIVTSGRFRAGHIEDRNR
jgi:hypothetical protein